MQKNVKNARFLAKISKKTQKNARVFSSLFIVHGWLFVAGGAGDRPQRAEKVERWNR